MLFDLGYPASEYKSDRPGYRGTSLQAFFERFSGEEACLAHIFQTRFGETPRCRRCGRESRWHRISNTRRFQHSCGQAISPLARTIFERTKIPLQLWFYAMLHFSNSAEGVTSLFLARHLGVTQKAAFRMAERIRLHMAALDQASRLGREGKSVQVRVEKLDGVRTTRGAATVVFLADDHRVQATVIGRARRHVLHGIMVDKLAPGASPFTSCRYTHKVLAEFGSRSARVPYLPDIFLGDAGHTDPIQSFQNHMRRPMHDSYRRVDHRNLWKYLKEFEFRYNRRHRSHEIFSDLVGGFPDLSPTQCGALEDWSSRGMARQREGKP